MARIILVDDSASARKLLGVRLREAEHEVQEVATAAEAAELALARPPAVVVTDLWMPGISGLQLCRLLRAEPRTAHIPIVLLTASDDRRSRFWARHAGATAYVTKTEVDRLLAIVNEAVRGTVPPPPSSMSVAPTTRGTVQERLSQLLDDALYDSTVAGQVRALSQSADDIEKFFSELATLASDVVGYRWLGLVVADKPSARIFVHTHPDQREAAEREARDALGVQVHEERRKAAKERMQVILDPRAVAAEWSTPPIQLPILFGTTVMGAIAIAPSRRGASNEDRRFVSLLASELGGPLQMSALVAEARRLAATDTLTGLLNRRAFIEGIAKVREKDRFHPASFLMLDVDHFKKVNDTRGHEAGDLVLQGVARVLANMARKSDLLARWGGEEFVLALSQTAEAGARVAAERVRRAIADAEYVLPNGDIISATASVGLASSQNAAWSLEDLLARADRAMYAAKARGRNRVETG